jgi:hypothetical protein
MRRILLVLTSLLVMAVMLMSSALPALAQGPPTFSFKALQALKDADADGKNKAIDINEDQHCVTLNTPGPEGTGHHSGFPDDSDCQPKP